MNKTFFLIAFTTILFVACKKEPAKTEMPKHAGKIILTAKTDEPTDRIALADGVQKTIVTWQNGDVIRLCFVQMNGSDTILKTAESTVSNISDDGKEGTFVINLPEKISPDKPYDLYGLYGGSPVDRNNPDDVAVVQLTPPPTPPTPALNGNFDDARKLMMRFEIKNIAPNTPSLAATFKHLGALVSLYIKNDSGSDVMSSTEYTSISVHPQQDSIQQDATKNFLYDKDSLNYNMVTNNMVKKEKVKGNHTIASFNFKFTDDFKAGKVTRMVTWVLPNGKEIHPMTLMYIHVGGNNDVGLPMVPGGNFVSPPTLEKGKHYTIYASFVSNNGAIRPMLTDSKYKIIPLPPAPPKK